MPDETIHGKESTEVPKTEPGTLIGVEWYKSEPVELEDQEKTAFKELCRKVTQRDMAARREEIILVWKKRLYDRGFQHLLPQRNGGWQLPAVGTGYNPQDVNSRSMFTTNIYNSAGQIIISALTREVPTTRFEPIDPDSDVDISAAEGAEKLESKIERDNALKAKMEDLVRYLWTDGRAIVFTSYMLDGQQFGFKDEDEDEGAVPEDEAKLTAQENTNAGEIRSEEPERKPDEQGAESDSGSLQEESGEAGQEGESKPRKPKGHECISVGGALEWKIPIKANCLAECSYAQGNTEIDLQIAKARYPDVADQMKASQGGPGGDDIDRLARVNVRLGVMDNYNTTDTQLFDVTEQKTFFRPAALLEVPDEPTRNSLIKKFPLGAYVTFCGEVFCNAYNATMDDHLTLVFGRAGDGAHRPGLGDWVVPIQEVLNNWLELSNDYFVRGVPNKWMDNEMFNVEALRDQTNLPGAVHPFDREPGVQMTEVIFEETPLQFPAPLQEFIQWFEGELLQFLSGAFPALSGGGDSAPTDTMGGMVIQRDQALGRIGSTWRRIKEGISQVKTQAIQMLARNHEGAITIVGNEPVTVEIETLKGGFYAFPETDENFPASYTQKQNQLAKVFADANTNPQLAELLFTPDNLELFKNAIGLEDFSLPQIEARDKQLGEATVLLKAAPVPNPALAQAQQQLKDLQAQGLMAAQAGGQPDPAIVQQAQQLQQQIAQLSQTPLVSSVEIRYFDDDQTEMMTCVKLLNSPRCRAMANGSKEEQEGYANLELHAKEHETRAKQKQAQLPPKGKPPSVSIALKDLPPKEASAAAAMAGIPATPADFQAEQVAEAAERHPGPGGIVQ
jgi:hypothetical protein